MGDSNWSENLNSDLVGYCIMDYWDKYICGASPAFQILDEEDMEELRSEKSVKSGKVGVCCHAVNSL